MLFARQILSCNNTRSVETTLASEETGRSDAVRSEKQNSYRGWVDIVLVSLRISQVLDE